MKKYQGKLVAPADAKFAVVVSRFNEFVSAKLLDGCLDAFRRHGTEEDNVDIVWSPGGFEMPVIASRLAESGQYAAVVCLGAIIRGGTDHNQYIATQTARGVAGVSARTGVPCIFGVLTCDTLEQAVERAGAKSGNKGADAAASAIEMVNLMQQLPSGQK